MFYCCTGITKIPYKFLSNTKLITDFSDVFAGCSNLTTIDEDFVLPTTTIIIDRLFKGCTKLTVINGNFKQLYALENASGTFADCPELTELPKTFVLFNKIVSIAGLCFNCIKLKEIPMSFWPASVFSNRVVDISNAFNIDPTKYSADDYLLSCTLPSDILWKSGYNMFIYNNIFYKDNNNIKSDDKNSAVPAKWFMIKTD